jgi:hypothetical protein
MLKDAVTVSRWKQRLRAQDPNMYRLLFPGEVHDTGDAKSPTQALVDVEVFRTLRSIRGEDEAGRQPQFAEPYEEVTEPIDKNGNICDPNKVFSFRTIRRPISSAPRESADVKELKEKVDSLTKSLQDEKLASLKTSLDTGLASLRSEITNQQSELKTLITEASSLAKTWIQSPGPIMQMTGSRLGFDVVTEQIPTGAVPEEARGGVIEGLRKYGYTARVVEREGSK